MERPASTARCLVLLGALLLSACKGQPNQVLPPPAGPSSCGHAHNDYEHPRPLLDALDAGMCSVEVDVWLVQGALLVAHDEADVDPARTLQSLYLDPLRDGGVDGPLILLIDIKSDAVASYPVLHQVLAGYSDILTQWEGDAVTPRAVTAIVSGERDRAAMEAQPLRYAAMDGRIADLDAATAPATLIPLASANWELSIAFNNGFTDEDEQRALLQAYADQAHQQGRKMRFWNSPDTSSSWQMQREAEVDLINTDVPAALQAFLSE